MSQLHIPVSHSTVDVKTAGDNEEGSLWRTTSSPEYENETVFQRHRLPPRSYYIPDTSFLLNGRWDFSYAPSPTHAPEPKSTAAPYDQQHVWTSVEVPGHWQLQGHGRP